MTYKHKELDWFAGVAYRYGISKRACINPVAHLYSYNTFRRFFYPSEGWVHPWNPHPCQRAKKPRKKHGMQAPLKGIVIRVITLISSENGVMNNPLCGINHRLNLQGLVAAFTALPGGYRNNNGNYNNMGNNGYFWSATENNSNNAWNRNLNYNNSNVNRNNNNKQNGFSVRCVRDLWQSNSNLPKVFLSFGRLKNLLQQSIDNYNTTGVKPLWGLGIFVMFYYRHVTPLGLKKSGNIQKKRELRRSCMSIITKQGMIQNSVGVACL